MEDTPAACAADFLTAKEAAERIKRPERTMENWRRSGEGPPFIRLGRRVAYRLADLERWLARRTYASRAAELAQRSPSR